MKRAVLGLLLWSGTLVAAPHWATPEALTIEDADTVLAEVAGVTHRVQLADIDAPENTSNPKLERDIARTGLDAGTLLGLGQRADDGLRRLLDTEPRHRLHFDPDARDRYGRVPGDLADARGRRVSERLVEAGYAIPLPTASADRAADLAAALQRARTARNGLWGSDAATFAAWAQLPPPD